MKPIGIQGFNTAEEAKDSANISVYGIDFWILKRLAKNNPNPFEGDYSWVAPIEYAEKLIKSGVAERVIL